MTYPKGPFVAAHCEHCFMLFVHTPPVARATHFCKTGREIELKPFSVMGVIDLDQICIYEVKK